LTRASSSSSLLLLFLDVEKTWNYYGIKFGIPSFQDEMMNINIIIKCKNIINDKDES